MWDETTRENLLALTEEVSFPWRTAQAALKLPVSAMGGSISEYETANVPLFYNLWYVIIVMLRFEDLKTQKGTGGPFFLEVDTEVALNILNVVKEKGNRDDMNEWNRLGYWATELLQRLDVKKLHEIAFHAQQPAQAIAITKAISAGW